MFSGNRVLSTERLQAGLPRVRALTEELLASAADRILGLYEMQGYPLASVFPRSVEPVATGRYVVTLGIDEGEQVWVVLLDFAGADAISPRVLTRTARFAAGPWRPRVIEAWQRNLDASGLVRVESRELVRREDGYGLRFLVRPERANRASGAVGFDAAESDLSGSARLQLANIANTGRRLNGGWESFRGVTRYELGYVEPWVLGSILSIHLSARHRAQDTTAARTELEMAVSLPLAAELELSLGTGYEQAAGIDPANRAGTAWAATGLNYDTRFPRVNPERGVMGGLRTRAGTREAGGASRFVGRVEADVVIAGPKLRGFVFENRLQGRAVETRAELSGLELHRLGGAMTVRGYREDEVIDARRVGWGNSELRYAVDRSTAAYGFFDAGLAAQSNGRRFLTGYGLGARVGTQIGGFEASYGLAPGVGPLSGKVHFRYEGEF